MKFWKPNKQVGPQDKELLLDDEYSCRVLSITKADDGSICFRERCDQYFSMELSRDQAIDALQEAIAWIKKTS